MKTITIFSSTGSFRFSISCIAILCIWVLWALPLKAQVGTLNDTTYFPFLQGFADSLEAQLKNKCIGYQFTISYKNYTGVVSRAWGEARRSQDPPARAMSANERIDIASVSKLMTGVAAVKLLTAKNISLDSYIYPYLPPTWVLGANIKLITFRQLLNHRSGIRGSGELDDTGLQTFISKGVLLSDMNINSYHNANFCLFRILIPRIENPLLYQNNSSPNYGADFVQHMQTNVFTPAGLSNITCIPPSPYPAKCYHYPSTYAYISTDWGDLTKISGGGGFKMSSAEINRFLRELNFGSSIVPASLAKTIQLNLLGYDVTGLTSKGVRYYKKNGGITWFGTPPKWWSGEGAVRSEATAFANDVQCALIINSNLENEVDQASLIFKAFDANVPFISTAKSNLKISGKLYYDSASGIVKPLANITVKLSNGATTVTGTDGSFNFTNLLPQAYTLSYASAMPSGYLMYLNSVLFDLSTGNSITGWTATAQPTRIFGKITLNGLPLGAVSVSSGSKTSLSVSSSGSYSIVGLVAGIQTVTPSLSGYTFTPTSRQVLVSTSSSIGSQIYGIDFTAIPSTPTLTALPQSVAVTAGGQNNISINVSSNTAWAASSNQSWATIVPASGVGNGTITLNVQANTTTTQRTASITISGSGMSRTVTITQAGAVVANVLNTNIVQINAGAVPIANGAYSVSVTANVTWTASSNQAWVTVSPTNGSGNANVLIQVQTNTTTQQRTAVVNFVGGGITKTVTVIQAGATSTLTAPTNTFITVLGTTSFRINWQSVAGAVSYQATVARDAQLTQSVINGNTTTTNFTATGLTSNTPYYYRIRAVAADGTVGAWTSTLSYTTPPNAPTALAPTNVSASSLTFNWTSITGATRYDGELSANASFSPLRAAFSTSGGNPVATNLTMNLTNPSLTPGTTYYYRVKAFVGIGASSYSNVVAFTVPALALTLKTSPNPSADILRVEVEIPNTDALQSTEMQEPLAIRLMDARGIVLQERSLPPSGTLSSINTDFDVHALRPGAYFVEVRSESGKFNLRRMEKFIKQ